jgi:hypothetical protein
MRGRKRMVLGPWRQGTLKFKVLIGQGKALFSLLALKFKPMSGEIQPKIGREYNRYSIVS